MEYATVGPGHDGRSRDIFAGLAEGSGFSVRECRVAAASGRLATIVRFRMARRRGAASALAGLPPVPGYLQGRVALALVQLRARADREGL